MYQNNKGVGERCLEGCNLKILQRLQDFDLLSVTTPNYNMHGKTVGNQRQ